jgi:uracil-DNA glycosylase family 4
MRTLEEIAAQVKKCTRCRLSQKRIQAVPGEGSAQAQIMFIGEGPGANEDRTGVPFCGAAGKLLDELLASIGIKREEVFIGNMVKCRPPGNRDPQEDEITACAPYLEEQLAVIQPKVVITLGRFSMAKFLPDARISQVHGKKYQVNNLTIIPMYHPAAGLYRGEVKQELFIDFAKVPQYLEEIALMEKEKERVTSKQMGFF